MHFVKCYSTNEVFFVTVINCVFLPNTLYTFINKQRHTLSFALFSYEREISKDVNMRLTVIFWLSRNKCRVSSLFNSQYRPVPKNKTSLFRSYEWTQVWGHFQTHVLRSRCLPTSWISDHRFLCIKFYFNLVNIFYLCNLVTYEWISDQSKEESDNFSVS